MPDITTLVNDIYAVAEGKKAPTGADFSVGTTFHKWFEEREPRKAKTLYFSEVGDPCLRRLHYKVNDAGDKEELNGHTIVKFLYGDMLEDMVLKLAEAAGHSVTSKQEIVEVEVNGWKVRGRIDARIDGVPVDVKSVTKFSEEKFKGGLVDDPFGYFSQLNGYATALRSSDAGFLTIQKELGHINYYPIAVNPMHFQLQVEHAIEAVSDDVSHLKVIEPVPQSPTSKNKKLATACSYCGYKKKCFPHVRQFIYSNGPVYLTEVVETPRVPEVV